MFCFRCQNSFDSNKHIPRLLTMCGHTLCEICCFEIHKNNKIQCLQCKSNTFIERIYSLPKNLALISIYKEQVKQCSKHNKRYEAFCSKQNILICIQCILHDGHKNHQMDSVTKSYQKELQKFNNKVQKFEQYLQSVKQKTLQNKDNQILSQKNYESMQSLIYNTFKQIKQLIQEEQENLLKKVQVMFITNDKKFEEKNKAFDQRLEQIQNVLFRIQSDIQLSQIQFLQQLSDRQHIFNSIKFTTIENIKALNFAYTKNSIIDNVTKAISNLKSSVKNNVSNFNSNPTPNIPKNSKNGYNQPLRGFRKAAFSNVSNSGLNNKPQKKVSSRKQSITHHIQHQPMVLKNAQKQKQPKSNNSRPSSTVSSGQKRTIKKIDILDENTTEWSNVDPKQSLCNSFMSNMTSFLSEKNSIYVVGGFNQESSNNIIKLNLQTLQWQEITPLNMNRSKFGCVFVDKKIYLFGGKKGKERLNDVEVFDIQTQKWSKLGYMNKTKSGFGITVIEDEIYLIGGNDGQNILNTVESFNIRTKQWKKLPSMNDPRDELAVTVGTDNKIYAIGGFGGVNNEPLKTVEVYDLKLRKWKYLPKMKHARRALSAAFLADGVYVIGGFDGDSYMASVQKYEQNTNQWVQVSSMGVARCTHSSVSIYQTQQIIVFGGFDFLPLNSIEKYSLINNQWQTIGQMPTPRFMHSSILIRQ